MEQIKKIATICNVEKYNGPYGHFYKFYFLTQDQSVYSKVITKDFPHWGKIYISLGFDPKSTLSLDEAYDQAYNLINKPVELVLENDVMLYVNRITGDDLVKLSQLDMNVEEVKKSKSLWEKIKELFHG